MPNLNRIRTVLTGVAGTPWYSNLYFDDIIGGPTVADQFDAVVTLWNSMATSIVSPVVATVEGDVAIIDVATGDLVGSHGLVDEQVFMSSADQALPWATQGLLRFVTDGFVHSRRVRGKMFVPGFTETNSTGGRPIPTFVAGLGANGAQLITDAGDTFVIWSRPFAGTPATPGHAANPARVGSRHTVVSCSAWSQWAVQRSRRD